MIETVLNVTADPGDRVRGFRGDAEPSGQPRSRRGHPEHLPVRRSRRLDRGRRSRRRAVARAGGPDGRPPGATTRTLSTAAGRHSRADEIDRRLADWFAGQPLPRRSSGWPQRAFPQRRWCRRRWSPTTRNCATAASSRHWITRAPEPGLYPCPPFARLAGQDKWLLRPPPTLGEHNEEILRDRCGLTDEELTRLATGGVIGTRPKGL